jgi:hypothetical protein
MPDRLLTLDRKLNLRMVFRIDKPLEMLSPGSGVNKPFPTNRRIGAICHGNRSWRESPAVTPPTSASSIGH